MAKVFFTQMQVYYKRMRDAAALKRVAKMDEAELEVYKSDPCVSSMELMLLLGKK